MGFVNERLSTLFYFIGESIGNKPKLFIFGSIFAGLFFGGGVFWAEYENKIEYLYGTTQGPVHFEQQQLDTYFPLRDHGAFDPSRIHEFGRFARLIIEAKDGGTLFRKSVYDEILEVDTLIHAVSITWENAIHNYSTLCGNWEGECYENQILELGQVMGQIENGSMRVNYPIWFNPETFNSHTLVFSFGGVTLSNDSLSVVGVKAVGLNYVLAVDSEEDENRGYEWEESILAALEKALPTWKHIRVFQSTHKSLSEELDDGTLKMIPTFGITIMGMVVFLTLTSFSRDWVRAKPWAGIFGMLCATLGSFAGIGLMCFTGVPMIGLSAAIPFIMLGIGIDDTFVILAAWRQTDPLHPVPKRLAECYSEAGVSITITTLTDMLSFYVGVMTPIPSVKFFSAYAGTCVLWIYLMQVFLFGGILAISGGQEAKNQHAIFPCIKATPKSKAGGKSFLYKLFCTGGTDKTDPKKENNYSDSTVMVYFRDNFSTLLTKSWFKALVISTFVIYLAISSYGLTTMQEGLQVKRIYRDDSYLYEYFVKEDQYFREFPYRIQVLITTPLDYSNATVQNRVYRMLEQMTNSTHMTHEYSENWLSSYVRYAYGFDINTTDEQSFIDNLRGVYLNGTPSVFNEDVKFDETFSTITASRFILQSVNVFSLHDFKDLVIYLRSVAQNQTDFSVTVYHPWFHFADQYIIIRSLTIQLIATASAIVILVAVIFIPSFICSVAVFFTIATIEIGVIGFMCLWEINLDLMSLICLIMCIGFSVDFAAHVSYAYISADGSSVDRIRKAMYSLGLPILQGGISTIIGVSGLFFVPAYSALLFAKSVTLVILFATFHGLFVLPVFLLIIRPERFSFFTSSKLKKTYVVNGPNMKSESELGLKISMT